MTTSGGTTTSAVDPEVPPAARAQTEAGAEAFTTFYMNQVNLGYQETDSSRLLKISIAACKSCKLSIDAINQYKVNHQHYIGDFATVSYVTISSLHLPKAEVFVATDTQAGKVTNDDNLTVETLPADKTSLTVYLLWQHGSWAVTEIKVNA